MLSKKNFLKTYLGGLLLLPVVLLALPASFFDNGQSFCLSVLLFDRQCYGCGMARAIQHLIHFDFEAACEYNKISFIVLPALIVLWVAEARQSYKQLKKTISS